MITVLKENYEKVLLATLLFLLATSSIVSILMVRTIVINSPVGGNEEVRVDKVPEVSLTEINLDGMDKPSSLEAFVYCRNSECNYLVHKSLVRCNWCKTEVIAEIEVNGDINRNGIEDKLELSWGLNLDDPNELLRDQDKDGFSNIEEYERKFSPIDFQSHPAIALRSSFVGVEKKFLPFKLKDVVFTKDIRGNQKIYVDAMHKSRGSFYLEVGEQIDWLKIIHAGESKGKKFAILKYFEEEIKIYQGPPQAYEGWPKYVIKNHLDDSYIKVSMNNEFYLKSLSGEKEKYKLMDFDEKKNEIKIEAMDLNSRFILGDEPEIKEVLE